MEWLQRLAPNLADRSLSRFGYRPQMTDQPKSDRVHNLYEHLEGYDQVHGTFSEETKPVSIYTSLEKRPLLRWGLLALLAGVGFTLVTRRKPAPRWMGWASQLNRLLRS